MHMAVKRRQHIMGQRDGDGRLADPAGPSERNEAIAQQASRQILQNLLPSDHPLQPMRQRSRQRMSPDATGDGRCWLRHAALHRGDKAISPAGNVRDVARAVFSITERLTQFGNVDPQTDFLDHEAGPRIGENFLLRNHLTRATYEQSQDIGCPSPQLDGHAVLFKEPRPERERAKQYGFSLVSSSCSTRARARGFRRGHGLQARGSVRCNTTRQAPSTPSLFRAKLQQFPAIQSL